MRDEEGENEEEEGGRETGQETERSEIEEATNRQTAREQWLLFIRLLLKHYVQFFFFIYIFSTYSSIHSYELRSTKRFSLWSNDKTIFHYLDIQIGRKTE